MISSFRSTLCLLAGLILLAAPLAAQTAVENGANLSNAIAAAEQRDWALAAEFTDKIPDPVAADIIMWMKLRDGQGVWLEYIDFLNRNGDWPGLKLLRKRGEASIPNYHIPYQVLAYFQEQPPQTGIGSIRLAEALQKEGRKAEAQAEAVRAWTTFVLTKDEAIHLLKKYPKTLANHHWTRMDMLLWGGALDRAEGMLTVVTEEQSKLAAARIGLRKMEDGVDKLIKAVPARLQEHSGLAYERFLWRVRKGRTADAKKMLIQRSASALKTGRADIWSDSRRTFARDAMRKGNPKTAYYIASNHHLSEGSDYADLEWLSGFIALRQLNKPSIALRHFQNFRNAVKSPISYGRAGYWLGRAYEALGDKENAQKAYGFGATYQTGFYGQLAAERGGFVPDDSLAGREQAPDWRTASFVNSTPYRALLLAHYAGEDYLAERFFVQLSETQDRTGLAQLTDLAMALDYPQIAVRTAKYASRFSGQVLPKPYFAMTELSTLDTAVKPEFALSIARRESEFDIDIISPVGARGLMQVMPKTASAFAGKLGLTYSEDRMITDWKYNARIGSAYLASLFDDYNGSYILAFAAYNAGPSRANRWIKDYGDPRRKAIDAIDWIEFIPYRETRNYVMRVMESVFVYRARISGKAPPLTISKDLKRG